MKLVSFASQTLAALTLGAAFAHAGNLVIQGDTVFDRDTELTWKRCSVGMRWAADQGRCVGVLQTFTFDEAQTKAKDGWRVPTKDDLKTLIVKRPEGQCQTDTAAFPDMAEKCPRYWSSTPYDASVGWYVDFDDGRASNYYLRSNSYAVRLVRGGQ